MPVTLRVAGVEVEAVSDGTLKSSVDNVIGMERGRIDALVRTPDDAILIPVNNFLIRRGGNTILIDAGAGNTMQPTLGHLPANLRAAGVDPAAVTHVVLTHIHPDHANGLVDDAGAPHYPNAEIVVHATEADFWLAPAAGREPETVQRNRARARINLAPYGDRIRRVHDGEEVLGLTPLLAPGHTPGHTCWLMGARPGALIAWGDVVHFSAIQIPHPDVAVTYDLDKDLARTTRQRVLDLVATERLAIAGAHVDAPGLGYVVRKGSGYAFEPAGG